MHFVIIVRVLGVLLMMFSLTQLVPIAISLWFGDNNYFTFLLSFAISFGSGMVFWFPVLSSKADLRYCDAFLFTVIFWSVLCGFCALTFLLSSGLEMSFTHNNF